MSRYSREYGILSFTSDHGLYENIEAFSSGDSGVYPGSGPEGHCARYGIEIRNINSHDNTLGYSGTAGNGVWVHDNKFHHNSTGMSPTRSPPAIPGMPQDCAKWENNEIYSNNKDLFNAERDEYCKKPIEQRDPKIVCPTFQDAGGHRASASSAATATSSAATTSTTTGATGAKLFWVPDELPRRRPDGQR